MQPTRRDTKGQEGPSANSTMESPAHKPRLDSWKEIAAHLGCDQRTAKRWEKSRGLPVHRLPGARSGVFAFQAEVDAWKRQRALDAAPCPAQAPSPTHDSRTAHPHPQPLLEPRQSSTPAAIARLPHGIVHARRSWSPTLTTAGLTLAALCLVVVALAIQHRSLRGPSANRQVSQPAAAEVHIPGREVQDIYLNGRYYWNRRTPADLHRALELFQQATEKDSRYAEAYTGLADTYFLMVEFSGMSPREAYPPAIAAARRAIQLNPSMSAAHRSLAFSLFYWNWDRVNAEKEFRRAIQLDPHDPTAHHWLGNMFMATNRYGEALAELEQARLLDPTSISIKADRAHVLQNLGRDNEARQELQDIEKTDPGFLSAHWYLAQSDFGQRDDRAYLDQLRQLAAITRSTADVQIFRAAQRGFHHAGEPGMSQAIAAADLRLYPQGLVTAFDVASALNQAGKPAEALRFLRLSYENHDTQFVILTGERVFPALKGNADFEQLAFKSLQPYGEDNTQARRIASETIAN
jgi:tetratricopeptide (TPR) repeat protein